MLNIKFDYLLNRKTIINAAPLLFIFIICIISRIYLLTQKNYWLDEVTSWHVANLSFKDIIIFNESDIHPPLYYFILKIWNYIFTDSAFSMRFFSVLISSIAVFPLYFLSKRFLNKTSVYIALFLFAILPLNIYFSQEARMYALNLFLNLTSVLFFIKITESRSSKLFDKNFLIYSIATLSALYTHYFSIFILTAEVFYLILNFRLIVNINRLKIIFGAIISLLIYSLWIPIMLSQVIKGQGWRHALNFGEVTEQILIYFKSILLSPYFYESDSFVNIYSKYIIISLGIGILLILIILKMKNSGRNFQNNDKVSGKKKSVEVIWFIFLIPLIISIILSFKQSIDLSRYLSILTPYFILLLVYYFSFNKYVFSLFILIIFSLSIYGDKIYFSEKVKYNDYREIVNFINDNHSTDDKIIVEPDYCGWILNFYFYEEKINIPESLKFNNGFDVPIDEIRQGKTKNLWLVMDFRAPDTSMFQKDVQSLCTLGKLSLEKDFSVASTKVKLFEFDLENFK